MPAHDKEMVSRKNWGLFLRCKDPGYASIEEIVFEIGGTDSNSTSLTTDLAVRRFVPEITLVHAQEIYSVFFGN